MHFIRVIHTVNVTHNGVPIYIDSISKDEDTANIHSLNQSTHAWVVPLFQLLFHFFSPSHSIKSFSVSNPSCADGRSCV
ncbi:small, acid-soluble spore protein, H family [Oscillibacter sp.]|uniref:small, acid-soluble spore protein, H family n=1 Tax=Oscillibacter sp. TaxID=1945593 RepID=UPI003392FDEA